MILQRVTSPGIAHNSYLIGSGPEAAVIDPRRDCMEYLRLAHENELRIKYIFETHRNEDYVIGSIELQKLTGAVIYHGPGLEWGYGSTLTDMQEFGLGSLVLKALHTPGHTDESISYVLGRSRGGTIAVFSGDSLFAGDVGRTDLYGPSEAPRMADNLFESIHARILPLGDEVILYPAHGAGSVCGTRIANRDYTTVGIEKKLNPMLKLPKGEFVQRKLAEKPEVPPYFKQMEKYNLEGPPLIVNYALPPPLTPAEFAELLESGALLIDTREPPGFGGAHIKGAYSIWLEGLPGFAGWFMPYDTPILLLLEDRIHLETATSYLTRLGYDRIEGYLGGGIESWYNSGLPVEGTNLLSVHQLKDMLDGGQDIIVLDIRDEIEWQEGHVAGAQHIYVGELEHRVDELPFDRPIATFCTVGHRAGIAASILLRAGFPHIFNVLGSMDAWKAAKFPISR